MDVAKVTGPLTPLQSGGLIPYSSKILFFSLSQFSGSIKEGRSSLSTRSSSFSSSSGVLQEPSSHSVYPLNRYRPSNTSPILHIGGNCAAGSGNSSESSLLPTIFSALSL